MAGNETDSPPPPTGVTPDKVTSNIAISLPTRNGKSGRWITSKPTVATPFKGAIPELANKVFITGPTHATRYDETYKGPLHYFKKNQPPCLPSTREERRICWAWTLNKTNATKDQANCTGGICW